MRDSAESTRREHQFASSVNKDSSNALLPENARPRFLGNLSRNGSEADSLIELYRQRKSELSQPSAEDVGNMEQNTDGEDPNSKWVHRDKLTMIEIQEYKERGMEVPAELLVRAGLRPDSKRSKKTKQDTLEHSSREHKKQRVSSPSPATGDEEEEEPYIPDDPRSPEEISADAYDEDHQDTIYQHGKLRSSSSRIPLATASPHPIPAEHIERSTPLPRKRAQSNGEMDEDTIVYGKVRSRGNSMSSQVLLDDTEAMPSMPGSPESPTKRANRGPRKLSTTIKVVPNSSTKSRSPSAVVRNSPGRPSTRSGPDGRPRTAANRPEGDPPWLDTMYKPDPRLPPDKQMLPTHAKRMMQEQWEREGKVGSAYDRNFTPVTVMDDANGQVKPLPAAPETQQQIIPARDDSLPSEWPMKPANGFDTTKNSSNEHAGYSTMPKVQSTPSLAPVQSPIAQQKPSQPLQVEEAEEKSKGCGCCVVM